MGALPNPSRYGVQTRAGGTRNEYNFEIGTENGAYIFVTTGSEVGIGTRYPEIGADGLHVWGDISGSTYF